MFPMTMTIHNQEQFDLIADALRKKMVAVTGADKPKTEKPKAEAGKKPDAVSQSSGTTSASETSAAPSDTGASTGLVYEKDVKPLVLKLVGKVGRDAALAFLQEDYQVEKADKVPADQWPGLVEKINKKLAA